MKNVQNFLCFPILVLLMPSLIAQPVFNGSVTFNTQAELNAWDPAYTSITGKLEISGAGITNLSPLQHIVSVGVEIEEDLQSNGLVIKFCPDLTSLAGLNALETVDGDVDIITNSTLQNLDGLESLQAVGGGLQIDKNAALSSIAGLGNLSSLGGELRVRENEILPNLIGLEGLTQIPTLVIFQNADLGSLAALSNAVVLQSIDINNNPALTSLDGLEGTSTLTGNLIVLINLQLSDCCAILDLLDTPGAVGGSIFISNNQTGCDNQAAILSACVADDDDDCDGVPNNQDFCPGGDDSMDGNGDHNADCHVFPGLQYLPVAWRCGNNNQKVLICHEGNTLCIAVSALVGHLAHGDYIGPCGNASCQEQHPGDPAEARTDLLVTGSVSLFPNPATTEIRVDLSALRGQAVTVRLTDAQGKVLTEQQVAAADEHSLRLNLEGLAGGLYFVQVQPAGQAVEVLKFTVVGH